RRQNARAEAREHFGHVFLAEVDAAAGTADALDTRDEPLAVRAVLEEQPQRARQRRVLDVRLLQQLEALDVTLVLKNARDVALDARRRHVDPRLLGGHRVADPREHICDWISHIPW